MMKALYDLRDMLEDELKKVTKKEEMDVASVELTYKMVDILKDIATIEAMESSDYTEGYSRADGMMYNGGSYGYRNRVYDDGSYAVRDSRGRYSRNGYSRNDEHDHMIQKLERMLNETADETVRRSIQKSIDDLRG